MEPSFVADIQIVFANRGRITGRFPAAARPTSVVNQNVDAPVVFHDLVYRRIDRFLRRDIQFKLCAIDAGLFGELLRSLNLGCVGVLLVSRHTGIDRVTRS